MTNNETNNEIVSETVSETVNERVLKGYFAGDEHCSVHYPEAHSGIQAAIEFAEAGDWSLTSKTWWLNVRTWREIRRSDESAEKICFDTHKIAVQPSVPKCCDTEHEWASDHDVVGGVVENPGVFGHAGGVKILKFCRKCGCGRTELTWDSDPCDGTQGLYSVEYEIGQYFDRVARVSPSC